MLRHTHTNHETHTHTYTYSDIYMYLRHIVHIILKISSISTDVLTIQFDFMFFQTKIPQMVDFLRGEKTNHRLNKASST